MFSYGISQPVPFTISSVLFIFAVIQVDTSISNPCNFFYMVYVLSFVRGNELEKSLLMIKNILYILVCYITVTSQKYRATQKLINASRAQFCAHDEIVREFFILICMQNFYSSIMHGNFDDFIFIFWKYIWQHYATILFYS